jgi:cobalt-zinc-cadmium resistance protein CzcA
MLNAIVDASLRYKVLVLVAFAVLVGLGVMAYRQVPVDAFPDVTPAPGEHLYRIPRRRRRRHRKAADRTDRSRDGGPGQGRGRAFGVAVRPVLRGGVLRTTSTSTSRAGWWAKSCRRSRAACPQGYGEPELGPNSSGLGQVFWYTIEDADKKLSAMDLRTLHDWTVRLILRTAPGVDDVTTWGGHEKQFQVQIDPAQAGEVRAVVQGGDGAADGQQQAGRRPVPEHRRRAVPGARPRAGEQRRRHRHHRRG